MTAVDKGELFMAAIGVVVVAANIYAAYRLSLAYNHSLHRIRTMVNWVCLMLPVQLAIVAFITLNFKNYYNLIVLLCMFGYYIAILFTGMVVYPLAVVLHIVWYIRYRSSIAEY